MDQGMDGDIPLGPAPESRGPDRGPQAQRTHLLEIDGGIMGGQLQMEWSYSQNCHRRESIEQAAQGFISALRDLIIHCQSPEAGGVTLSDVSDFGWGQDDLDDILDILE
jgi:non-ribosomal peptide synthase protein (TIGR01720 family)